MTCVGLTQLLYLSLPVAFCDVYTLHTDMLKRCENKSTTMIMEGTGLAPAQFSQRQLHEANLARSNGRVVGI